MKKLFALFALLALACGAEDPDAGPPEEHTYKQIVEDAPESVEFRDHFDYFDETPPAPPSDFGQVQQRIVYSDAYGIDDLQNRCWFDGGRAGWAGGYCRMPNGQSWTVVFPDANVTQGCDADSRVGFSNAAVDFKHRLEALGTWKITLISAKDVTTPFAFDAHVASFVCSTGAPSANTYGNTPMPTKAACPLGSLAGVKCLDAAPGTIVSVDAIRGPIMYESNWHSKSWFQGLTSTQRREVARNFALHELYHVAGLGHDTCAESPMMGMGGCGLPNAALGSKDITSFEANMLDCVNTRRDGLFQNCL
jgi:hypothetical protein